MNLAFLEARKNLGNTKYNPAVGCVIVKNNNVISAGTTSINGRPHAEHNAIINSKFNVKNSYLYSSLEPCSHYGVTPPCTNLIIKKKIKKVIYSTNDLDFRSKKRSKKILQKKKIIVKNSLLNKRGIDFYESYILQHSSKLPLVDAKIALSKDYLTKNLKKKWITGIESQKRSHLLRSMYDCIISTSKSINDDNSMLDCRIKGLEKKTPDLIILDRKLKLKKNLKLYKKIKNRKILLFTCFNNKKKISFLKRKGIKVYMLNSLNEKKGHEHLFLYS